MEKVWILSQLAGTVSPPVGLGHPELNDNSSGHFDFFRLFLALGFEGWDN